MTTKSILCRLAADPAKRVMTYLVENEDYSRCLQGKNREPAYEHLIYRVKSIDSMNVKSVEKALLYRSAWPAGTK